VPELPEVETIVGDLRPHLAGRTIVRCELLFPTIVRHPEPEMFIDSVAGMRIASVARRGKYIMLSLAQPLEREGGEVELLVCHLGMTGHLRIVDAAAPLEKHTHAVFELDDGRHLRYHDPRRFGRRLLGTEPALLSSRKLPNLGPAPLEPAFAAHELYRRLHRRHTTLKALLLHQPALAGGGATAADESCCGPATACCGPAPEVDAEASRMGYTAAEWAAVPEGANLGLGCGNPQAIAALRPGEVLVDLGSGAGFDCLLAASQVGAAGRVIGVDMTHEMLKPSQKRSSAPLCVSLRSNLASRSTCKPCTGCAIASQVTELS